MVPDRAVHIEAATVEGGSPLPYPYPNGSVTDTLCFVKKRGPSSVM